MRGLEVFITAVIPITIFTLFVIGYVLKMVGMFCRQRSWNRVDQIEDEIDSIHYEQRRKEKCQPIGSTNQMKLFAKSPVLPSPHTKAKSLGYRRTCRANSNHIGVKAVGTTFRFMS